MTEPRVIPLYMGDGDEQLQIGEVVITKWNESEIYSRIMADIDVFPGERLTFARAVCWDDIVRVSHHRYPTRPNIPIPTGWIFQNSGRTMNVEGLLVPSDTWTILPKERHNNISDCTAAGCPGCTDNA